MKCVVSVNEILFICKQKHGGHGHTTCLALHTFLTPTVQSGTKINIYISQERHLPSSTISQSSPVTLSPLVHFAESLLRALTVVDKKGKIVYKTYLHFTSLILLFRR